MKFKQLVVAITGATSGIGKETAKYFKERGHIVYSLSIDVLNDQDIKYLICDVTNEEQVKEAFSKIKENEGRLDVLINNAGIGISGALEYQEKKDIEKIIDVNLIGAITCSKYAIPLLRETKGKIINLGSIAGELAIPFQTMYSITKSGISMLTHALYNELRPFNIKVTCVMPGDTATGFTDHRHKEEKNDFYQDRIQNSVKRMEHDERHGDAPIKVSKTIYNCVLKKNPPIMKAVDKKYAFLLFIRRFLSDKLVEKILYSLYGK